MRLLIDTNVILDALMARDPWDEAAQNLLIAVAEGKAEGCVTASSFTDIHYLLRKKLGNEELTKQAMLGLLTSINVLDVNGTDCEKAFGLPMSDYEDALLAYCARRHRADYIVTRNPKHFENSPVRIIEPEKVLGKL